MTQARARLPERLYTLDALRGIAALAVVFWHWQHFFFQGAVPGPLQVEQQPLYGLFAVFYRQGGDAVALFFSLSGFIFFWLFGQAVARRELGARQFFLDRFSRIYPLFLLTFVMVAVLQQVYSHYTGHPFVYPFNDLYHAVLNLLLAPAWGLEKGWSFNAPAWSISVEVLLYAAFFVLLRYSRYPVWISVGLIALAVYVFPVPYKVPLGVLSFFCGGLAYRGLTWLLENVPVRVVGVVLGLGCAVAWWASGRVETYPLIYRFVLLFPLTIMALVAWHRCLEPLARHLAWLGDISYAAYLLHFPLQICAAMLADKYAGGRGVFYQPWTLLLFLAVLMAISATVHRCFERPMQRWLRERGTARQAEALNQPT